ncbi:MAG: hypothetical protein IJW21_01370 [Clostridia bacterium]|nr:hypothetical protein [Clostridia bacterium]
MKTGDFMKKTVVNGERVPYEATIAELQEMLASGEMKDFTLACEALSRREEREAYEAMKQYIDHKDKYRRLYVLKTIFRHPCAARELIPWLEENIASGEKWFSENGLEVVAKFGVKINREFLLSAVEKYWQGNVSYSALGALEILEPTEENFRAFVTLFEKAAKSGQKEILAEILCKKYLPLRAEELFELFAVSDFAKVRITAARIGKKYGLDMEKLKFDENGHVRKIAEKGLGKLEFLRKYTGKYTVEFSKDLESAIIVNPYKDEYIEIDLDYGSGWEEYTVVFPGTHGHFDYCEDAEEYIDDYIGGRFCSVCCLHANGSRLMSTSMESAEITGLTYEKMREMLGYERFGCTNVAKIEIRGFSPENDYDVTFEEKDGKTLIKTLKVSESE